MKRPKQQTPLRVVVSYRNLPDWRQRLARAVEIARKSADRKNTTPESPQ
jgi:hypothetical protein